MAYSTPAELRAAVSGETGLAANPPQTQTGTAADLSNTELNDAIAEADATIDSFLSGRYTTPIPNNAAGSVPQPIGWWSRNIAAYYATLAQRKGQDFSDNDPIARRYNGTMLALTAVRDGKQGLPNVTETDAGGDADNAATGAGSPYQTYSGGDLFQPGDFDLVYQDNPRWWS